MILSEEEKLAGWYDVKVGNRTWRLNNRTGEGDVIGVENFKPKRFQKRGGAWRETEGGTNG